VSGCTRKRQKKDKSESTLVRTNILRMTHFVVLTFAPAMLRRIVNINDELPLENECEKGYETDHFGHFGGHSIANANGPVRAI